MSLRVRRTAALAAVALLAPVALGASACSKPETIRTYTPAHGVNAQQNNLKARNIVLVADGSKALLSGVLVSTTADELTGVSGVPVTSDGGHGSPVRASLKGVEVKPDVATIIGAEPKVELSSGDIKPGQTVELTLNFSKAGQMTMTVPVMDKSHPDYSAWPQK